MNTYFKEETIHKMLKLAGVSNIIWGLFLILFPRALFTFLDMPQPIYVEIWQWVGVIVVLFGLGYVVASLEPQKHWLIIFIGFFGKLIGSFIFLKGYLVGTIPLRSFFFIILDNLIWIIPFYHTLMFCYEINTQEESGAKKFNDLIKFVKTTKGQTLYDLSEKNNVLLIFVRHLGCTFCRETVSEIAKIEKQIAGKNLLPVYIHMSDPCFGDEFFSQYYPYPIAHVSDPQRLLYKSLNLKRGSLRQLFGPSTWIRGLWAGIFKGHGLGPLEGDALQLGGYFVLSRGQIVFEHKMKSASELFDLEVLPKF